MNIKNSLLLYVLVLLALLTSCAKTANVSTQFADDAYVSSVPPTPSPKILDAAEADTSEIQIDMLAGSFDSTELSTTADEISDAPQDASDQEILVSSDQYQEITGVLEIAFLDVGQGDSIYICLPNGESMLIDAGESSESGSVIQYIKDNNAKDTIDYLIATHPHSDHIGGMSAVIEAFEIKSMWMPDIIHNTKTFENLLDTIEESGLLINTAASGKTLFDYGNLKAEFIAPHGIESNNLNNYSAAILLTYNESRFLFMGDAEKETEAEIMAAGYDVHADVVKIGHHGSKTSSTKAFIQKVAPKYAVISCGKGNSYGHPADETLAIITELGIDVKRTDESGTIIFSCDGENISCTTFQTEVQARAPNTVPTGTLELGTAKEAPAKTQEQSIIVYVTKTGTKYHSDICRYLSQSKISMDLDEASQKYGPCSVCNPPR